MRQKEEFFLPMMHEATDRFLRHLTVEVAKPIFDLLKYRQKYELTEEAMATHFEQVIIEEQTYQYYLSRMRMELEQLFELTSPYLHKKIRVQINSLPVLLEKTIERKNIILQLRASNKFSLEKVYRPDGQFDLMRVPRNKPVLDLALLTSPFFDEYVAVLNSMLFYYKNTVSAFEAGKKTQREEPVPPVSEYLAPPLKVFTLNWNRFLDLCFAYSQKSIEWNNHKDPVIECINKEHGKYLWKGDLPMLGEFITMLEKDVQILRPLVRKKALAELFLKFFGLGDTFPDPHFLSLKIRPISPPKKFYFSDMKKVSPLT